ncbi:MAG TPA: helix-turn-helix transcriptional regulator [Candidatus Elarobacter sp.]|nr:helix-turn-helix transcriptional regulator [Candidatus Elarobacter sp.]
MSETFAQRLRRLRNSHGYSVADLATTVGASEGTIRQLENGSVKSPSFLLGIRLAERLDVDARYLALGEGSTYSERMDSLERRLAKIEERLATLPSSRR